MLRVFLAGGGKLERRVTDDYVRTTLHDTIVMVFI
jgi:hypothetical protein